MATSPALHDQRLPRAKGSSYNLPGVSCVGRYFSFDTQGNFSYIFHPAGASVIISFIII